MKPSLLIIQPVMASYREPLFQQIAAVYKVTLVVSPSEKDSGFEQNEVNFLNAIYVKTWRFLSGRLLWQTGLLRIINQIRPNKIFITPNPRNVGYWLTLCYAVLKKIPIYSYGQGLFDKVEPSLISKIMFWSMLKLTTRYICYTDTVEASLSFLGEKLRSKIRVADNMLVNNACVDVKLKSYEVNGILYLGRLRESNQLKLLFDALRELKNRQLKLVLHVIGDGPEKEGLLKYLGNDHELVQWHGKQFDAKYIKEVSLSCFVGCYPGDAGLSVVHYMSLCLPVVCHDSMAKHMGPEPSYLKHGVNSFMFERNNQQSLTEVLDYAYKHRSALPDIGQAAKEKYDALATPGLGQKWINIFNEPV